MQPSAPGTKYMWFKMLQMKTLGIKTQGVLNNTLLGLNYLCVYLFISTSAEKD